MGYLVNSKEISPEKGPNFTKAIENAVALEAADKDLMTIHLLQIMSMPSTGSFRGGIKVNEVDQQPILKWVDQYCPTIVKVRDTKHTVANLKMLSAIHVVRLEP